MESKLIDSVLQIINFYLENVQLTKEQITQNLTDLGMDSISFIQIIVALEEEFECEIPDEKLLISEMDTVEKIYNVLNAIDY